MALGRTMAPVSSTSRVSSIRCSFTSQTLSIAKLSLFGKDEEDEEEEEEEDEGRG